LRLRSVSLTVSSLLLFAGCGGSDGERREPARLARALAHRLATESTAVAESLERRDVCSAARHARLLRAQTTEAINAGRVPARLQEELSSRVNALVARIRCRARPRPAVAPAVSHPGPPARPQAPARGDPGREHDEDAGKGKGEAKGKGKGEAKGKGKAKGKREGRDKGKDD
jgi:hypothetical protein